MTLAKILGEVSVTRTKRRYQGNREASLQSCTHRLPLGAGVVNRNLSKKARGDMEPAVHGVRAIRGMISGGVTNGRGCLMAKGLRQMGAATFSSLRIRNYRLYYIGQIISTSGTWMQSIAQAWLVLQLTNSGTALGLIVALQAVPVLVLAPFGGLVADRFPKRRVLLVTQSALASLALILGVLVATGVVQLWMVAVLAFGLGLINAVDIPTRQSFVVEMVGEAELKNAVTLYSSLVNLSRIIGPTIAGILIATIGLAPCFILNGLSYSAVVVMLLIMRASELHPAVQLDRARGQVVAGLRYVWSTPVLRHVLVIMGLIGTLTYEFQVSLPMVAKFGFQGTASSLAVLSAALGVGAVTGGLMTASRRASSFQAVVMAALFFGATTLAAAFMPSLTLAAVALIAVGFCSITFTAMSNTVLQLTSAPQMRGRVMSLGAIAFLGSTTIGGPTIGFIGQHAGPQWALATGGLAALAAGAYGVFALRREPVQAPGNTPP
jgi:MFS family permease